MIRIPFSATAEGRLTPELKQQATRGEETAAMESERTEILEARLATLEIKLVTHAEELKVQVSERIMRIQSRLENALQPFQTEVERNENEETAGNVVAFSANAKDLHHLHASNALEALNELNQTLRLTREHLEALASSVDRMRQSVECR